MVRVGATRTARKRAAKMAVRAADAVVDLEALVERREFTTVFQPIVRVDSLEVVGFEALTRFRNGWSPEHVFTAATRCGLGPRLEAATIEYAFDRGHHPADTDMREPQRVAESAPDGTTPS